MEEKWLWSSVKTGSDSLAMSHSLWCCRIVTKLLAKLNETYFTQSECGIQGQYCVETHPRHISVCLDSVWKWIVADFYLDISDI